jgi:predicted DNA-binding transcriptional regulator AlpA
MTQITPLPARSVEELVDRQAMARILGISVTSLDLLRKEPGFPEASRTWGLRVVRFKASHVQAWLAARDEPQGIRRTAA